MYIQYLTGLLPISCSVSEILIHDEYLMLELTEFPVM